MWRHHSLTYDLYERFVAVNVKHRLSSHQNDFYLHVLNLSDDYLYDIPYLAVDSVWIYVRFPKISCFKQLSLFKHKSVFADVIYDRFAENRWFKLFYTAHCSCYGGFFL